MSVAVQWAFVAWFFIQSIALLTLHSSFTVFNTANLHASKSVSKSVAGHFLKLVYVDFKG